MLLWLRVPSSGVTPEDSVGLPNQYGELHPHRDGVPLKMVMVMVMVMVGSRQTTLPGWTGSYIESWPEGQCASGM